MKKIVLLSLAFCFTILFTVNFNPHTAKQNGVAENEEIGYEREDKQEKFDEPLQFFQFHQGIRTAEGETKPGYQPGYKTKELQKAIQRKLSNPIYARTESVNGVLEFTERGPSNVPGRTRAILVLPGDATNSTWLAGSATGGIWKTTNAGQSWVEKSGDFPVYPISSLVMSESDPNTVYAGTGEFISSIYSAVGDGIFKSTDKGETWTQLTSTASNQDFSIITRIIVSPTNKNILLASTVPSVLVTTDQKSKIFRSTNGGISWTKVYENDNPIQQIIATPGNFNTQYAGINGIGVAKSVDGGQTWALSNTNMSPSGRVEIDVSPADPTRVFASCEGSKTKTGSDLYISNDSGANWTVVDVRYNNNALNFLNGQGHYDNHAICDPFNKDIIYFGGVDTFRSTITGGTSVADDYILEEDNTQSFLALIPFNNPNFFQGGRLQAGPNSAQRKVEIRFGPGINQMAHRFLTPVGATSGVAVSNYTYTDYVSVPLQAWDVTNSATPKQLMVSFRDQSRNKELDFLAQNFDAADPLLNSREYVYIHSADYNATTPLFAANSTGGQETQFMYAFFPSLPQNATWTPSNLPTSKLVISYSGITKQNSSTVTVTDVRNQFDKKNSQNQAVLDGGGVHADHHCSTLIITSVPNKTYRLLIGTDGGVFLSKESATPGITDDDFTFTGNGFNTSQFYGADKKPGEDIYIGGMQDNGTRISMTGEVASKTTKYKYAIGGDGFEVLWNSLDGKKIIGSLYNNAFFKTIDGGTSWVAAFSGFPLVSGYPDGAKYPFVSKLAHSRNVPDVLFAVGSDGVWKSNNFGSLWTLTPITNKWGSANTFFDVEVSRANA
ncbi:MAG: WD40/YVTN/BNR-like repeat-containing protein, partial [Flammeovirgaceae bacterium]